MLLVLMLLLLERVGEEAACTLSLQIHGQAGRVEVARCVYLIRVEMHLLLLLVGMMVMMMIHMIHIVVVDVDVVLMTVLLLLLLLEHLLLLEFGVECLDVVQNARALA